MAYRALMPKSVRGSARSVSQNARASRHHSASAVSPDSRHYRVTKHRSPNKCPKKSKNEWNKIWPVIECIYSKMNATGEETLAILEVTYGFEVSINTFKTKLKERGCEKNNQGQTQLTSQSKAHLNPERPRTRRSIRLRPPYQNTPYPEYVLTEELWRRPHSLQPKCYIPQTRLVFHVMKYVNGFFDDANRRNMDNPQSVFYNGEIYSIRCQEIYGAFLRKWQAELIKKGEKEEKKNTQKLHFRFNENARLKADIANVLTERVFGPLMNDLKRCSPQILGFLWNVFRVLHELSSQLEIPKKRRRSAKERAARAEKRQSRGTSWKRPGGICDSTQDILSAFFCGIQQLQSQPEDRHHQGLADIFQAMVKIEQNDLRQTICVISLCTARTLSSWLEKDDPLMLKTWATYYRLWGNNGLDQAQFITSYQTALQLAKSKYGIDDDYTVSVLCDFVEAAQTVCEDKALVQSLARELWKRTATSYGQELRWSLKARGLATAALALAQASLADYTEARRVYTIETRARLGRHKSQVFLALNPKPSPRHADHVAETLKAAIRSLDPNDWDCKLALAALRETFGRCDDQFFFGKETAKQYQEAKALRKKAIETKLETKN
ncbi:hypothetical protein PGQ11_011074 [Apiospora arundinis]|uniref:Clr5 domain-containing protein n=1 Tax=Apiospora arundinis TaxID=335852 RepID=A0ABR2HZ17_9PEZI